MLDGRFVGLADFVVLDGDRYQLLDTKLARSAKVEALLQLAAYADTLRTIGVPVAPTAELILGDATVASIRVDELIPVYLPAARPLQACSTTIWAGEPVAWADPSVRACFRCPNARAQRPRDDDLLLVAGMRVSQRATLIDAGISTVADLAASTTARWPDSGPHRRRR